MADIDARGTVLLDATVEVGIVVFERVLERALARQRIIEVDLAGRTAQFLLPVL